MKTPFGRECPYFYGDYHRGMDRQECRLLMAANPPQHWQPKLCETCPVPSIAQANACKQMVLSGKVTRTFASLFLKRVEVKAYCRKTEKTVTEPHVGCGECHPFPEVFEIKP